MLLCSFFPHTREQRGDICWCFSPAGAWQYLCLLAIIQVCIGGRVRGAPESYSGRQTVFFHMPVRGTVRIEPPTIKVVWPREVWMTRAALASYEVLHWPPHSYARRAACEDTARALLWPHTSLWCSVTALRRTLTVCSSADVLYLYLATASPEPCWVLQMIYQQH